MTGNHRTPSRTTPDTAALTRSGSVMGACKAYFVDRPLIATSNALHLLAHRLEEQAEITSLLSRCQTLSDAADAQSRFLRCAIGDRRKQGEAFPYHPEDAIPRALGHVEPIDVKPPGPRH